MLLLCFVEGGADAVHWARVQATINGYRRGEHEMLQGERDEIESLSAKCQQGSYKAAADGGV